MKIITHGMQNFGENGVSVEYFFAHSKLFLLELNISAMPVHSWPTYISIALLLFGAYRLSRKYFRISNIRALWLPVFLLVPIVSSLVLHYWFQPHYVPSRVDHMMFFAFAMIMAVGIADIPIRIIKAFLSLTLLCVSVETIPALYPNYNSQIVRAQGLLGSDQELAETIARQVDSNDVVICTSLTHASLHYYLGRFGIHPVIMSFPRETEQHLGAQNDRKLAKDIPRLIAKSRKVMDDARNAIGPGGKLIVIRRMKKPVNKFLAPEPLKRDFGVKLTEDWGKFVQSGTGGILSVEVYEFDPSWPRSR